MKRMITAMVLVLSVSAVAGYDYTISSGYFYDITLVGSEKMLITGGGGLGITAKDFSVLDIKNTTPYIAGFGGIGTIDLWNTSRLNFSGGQVDSIHIDAYAEGVLSGGLINRITNESQLGLSHIEVVCKQYSYNVQTKKLTGIWGDNSNFNIQLVDLAGYATTYSIMDFTIIPEPATLALLALGGLLIRRK